MIRLILLFLFCIFVITAIGGCGYTTSSIIATGADSLYVSNFINKVKVTEEVTDRRMYIGYRSGMELDITRETIDRFILDGNLKVTSLDRADLILEGDLIDFKKEALRFDANNNIIEFRIKLVVDLRLRNRQTNELILEEKSFTGESTYRTTGEFARSEEAALRDAIKDVASRIVERIIESW